MTTQIIIQTLLSMFVAAIAGGLGAYIGTVKAMARHEERLDTHRREIDEIKTNVKRLEEPFFRRVKDV